MSQNLTRFGDTASDTCQPDARAMMLAARHPSEHAPPPNLVISIHPAHHGGRLSPATVAALVDMAQRAERAGGLRPMAAQPLQPLDQEGDPQLEDDFDDAPHECGPECGTLIETLRTRGPSPWFFWTIVGLLALAVSVPLLVAMLG